MKQYADDPVAAAMEQFHKATIQVRSRTKDAQEKNKRYYDQRAKKDKFEVGDPVYWYNPTLKLDTPWMLSHGNLITEQQQNYLYYSTKVPLVQDNQGNRKQPGRKVGRTGS